MFRTKKPLLRAAGAIQEGRAEDNAAHTDVENVLIAGKFVTHKKIISWNGCGWFHCPAITSISRQATQAGLSRVWMRTNWMPLSGCAGVKLNLCPSAVTPVKV